MNVVRMFGLSIDKDGALHAIKEVTDRSVEMARAGVKAAHDFAEGFREHLDHVAKQYVPETVRAIETLKQQERTLASMQVPGILSGASQYDVATHYAAVADAIEHVGQATKHATATHEPHIMGLSRIGNTLSTMVGHAAGVPPVFERIADALGVMALGHLATVGVLAGFAAIAFAWERITEVTREATKAQNEAIEAFEKAAAKRALGVGGETVEQVRLMRERIETDRQRIADLEKAPPLEGFAAGKGGIFTANAAAARLRAEEIAKLQHEIADGEAFIAEKVRDAGKQEAELSVRNLAELVRSHQATAAEIRNAEALLTGLRRGLASLSGDGNQTAQRAGMIAQITELNEALHPSADATAYARLMKDISAVVRESADSSTTKGLERAKAADTALARETTELAMSQRLLDAARLGTEALKAQRFEEEVYQELDKTGLSIGDARLGQLEAEIRLRLRNRDALKAITDATAASEKAAEEAARKSAEETKRQYREIEQTIKSGFTTFFTDIITHGKNAFQSLWDAIKQGFVRLVAELLAARVMEKIAGLIGLAALSPAVAGAQSTGGMGGGPGGSWAVPLPTTQGASFGAYAGLGLSSLAVGYGVGRGAGSYAGGAFGGALSGAASGALLGNVIPGIGTAAGAAIGGVTGLIGGILGFGSASKEAAKQLAEAQRQVALSTDALRAQVNRDTLAGQLAAVAADREQRRKQIEDAYAGRKNEDERNRQMAIMNQLEDRRIEQLKQEFALQQRYAQEDLQVRLLRAQGKLYEAEQLAFAEQQQREYEAAVLAGKDAIYLATLAEVQRAEALAHTTAALQDAVRNAPTGFKVQGYSYDFATPAPNPGSTWTPVGGSSAGSQPAVSIDLRGTTFQIKGGTGPELLTDFMGALRQKANEIGGTNMPASRVLDRLPS